VSPAATVLVIAGPTVTSPTGQTGTVGQAVVFSASADDPRARVQWQVSTDGGQTFTNVRGGTRVALVVKKLTLAMDGLVYRAVFTNAVGVSASAPATLSVLP